MSVFIKTMRVFSIAVLLCLALPQPATAKNTDISEDKLAKITQDAEDDHIEAQIRLGLIYLIGQDVPRNTDLAMKWLLKAADEKNDAYAQYLLGAVFVSGDIPGIPVDDDKARMWFQKALNQGFEKAATALKEMDDGTAREAIETTREKAAAGDPEAKYSLAYYYESGLNGVEKDRKKYLELIGEAAHAGYDKAQYSLGIALWHSNHHKDSLIWLERAADQDNMDAQYHLGITYIIGDGAAAQPGTGLTLLHKAASKGDPRAQRFLNAIAADRWGGGRFKREEYMMER